MNHPLARRGVLIISKARLSNLSCPLEWGRQLTPKVFQEDLVVRGRGKARFVRQTHANYTELPAPQ